MELLAVFTVFTIAIITSVHYFIISKLIQENKEYNKFIEKLFKEKIKPKKKAMDILDTTDFYNSTDTDKSIPLDEFNPDFGKPIKINREEEDQYTKLEDA